jgi:monoamine oxidase
MLVTDLAVQQVWPIGRVLVCYVNGRGVESLVAGGRAVERSLEALCRVLPRARAHFVEGRVVDWRRQPYAGGGFPFVPVGATRRAAPPAGPVRFAGDWTANWMGFVEGALESAERVVAEITHEHGLS